MEGEIEVDRLGGRPIKPLAAVPVRNDKELERGPRFTTRLASEVSRNQPLMLCKDTQESSWLGPPRRQSDKKKVA